MESWKPGDDPNTRDGPGRTILHRICQNKALRFDEASLLEQVLKTGGDPNLKDSFGRTPLSLVCMESGLFTAARMLLQHSSDVHSKDEWGRTALHWCSDRGWLEVAQLLLEYGANLNEVTKNGDTPLMWASKAGRSALVQLFLSQNCDMTTRNNRDETASDVAADSYVALLIASAVEEREKGRCFAKPSEESMTSFGGESRQEGDGSSNVESAGNQETPSENPTVKKPFSEFSRSETKPNSAAPKKLKISLRKRT